MFSILVIDDSRNTRKLMDVVLKQNGYQPFLAEDSKTALEIMDHNHIDLIILDIMMPGMDGYEFLKTIRDCHYTLPVLMVSAKDTPEDKRRGFLSGTDDYMVKPVDEVEMILRIQALLRRSRIAADHCLTIGETTLDYDAFEIRRKGEVTVLPKKEFQLLFKFLSFPNKTFTRNQLMSEFWDLDSDSEVRTVDVHINRLREHLKANPDFEIITVRGLGYKAIRKTEESQ
ncbi:MAG: response regulator transcription factor [Clostridia bacterium]|nr:response regulator transcription factor [Clostridia bacterium]